jgi:hypothetical protein
MKSDTSEALRLESSMITPAHVAQGELKSLLDLLRALPLHEGA